MFAMTTPMYDFAESKRIDQVRSFFQEKRQKYSLQVHMFPFRLVRVVYSSAVDLFVRERLFVSDRYTMTMLKFVSKMRVELDRI